MKTKIFYLATAVFMAHLGNAQVLYIEDFESYNIGTFSTDLTGATPAQGGWYTLANGIGIPSINNYKIVSDPNNGNVLKILEGKSFSSGGYYFYRTDLNTYWQQRTPGNNVLKLAFDIYTDSDPSATSGQLFHVALYNDKELLANFHYQCNNRYGSVALPSRGFTTPQTGPMLTVWSLPANSWVTIELYIDYDNDKVYLSVPALNYTIARDTFFPLYLTGGGDHDDNPVKLELSNGYGSNMNNPLEMRIDNINLSARSTAPTVSINEFVSEKFNLYPNPAEDMVTITNSENIGIEEITVYDVNGKNIKSLNSKNANEIQLNIEELQSGTYFLHIVTDEGTAIKKLLKK